MRALTDLRRTRRRRRLGDTEWFDLAYRVYLAGFFGGCAILIASDRVGDVPLSDADRAEVLSRGPAWLGVLAAVTIAAAIRGGSQGGPLTVEDADVVHLLLAPVDRGTALRRPYVQRLRSAMFAGALGGGVAGLLAEQRIPSDAAAFTWWGAVFGATLGAAAIGTATLAHAARVAPWLATTAGGALVGWQLWAAIDEHRGPLDDLGSIALRAEMSSNAQLIALLIVAVVAGAAAIVVGRLRLEQLARRSGLVSQLRFAVTMQDLRTVVLLRRQLRLEHPRLRPWIRIPRLGPPGVRRGAQGLARTPAARLGRLVVIAALAGAAFGVGARGTTLGFLAGAIMLFVLGLDMIEPLSQEIDHPERTAAIARPTGRLHADLLVASAVLAIPVALVGAATCALVSPPSTAAAFALAVPVTWCALVGGVVNAVRDEYDPTYTSARGYEMVVPPEVSGFNDLFRIVWPVVVGSAGVVAALAARATPTTGMLIRVVVGLLLWLALVRWWLVQRLELARRWRSFVAGAKP